ncbi:MAG: type III-B CRISPR module-associated protein Cmr5 [Acidobacteria bacterium]|nr:type III-B CRISPR module-associated protein Cmr5 [Acidobacteriota bacterium]
MSATRSRAYATSAFQHINAVAKEPEGDRRKYGTMVLHLPILIRTAGLAQAIAFVSARGNEAQKKLIPHLEKTLGLNGGALEEKSRVAALAEYRDLSRRTLEALDWYKRFVQSVLKVEASDDLGEDSQ